MRCLYINPDGDSCALTEPHRHVYEQTEHGVHWWVEPAERVDD